MILPLYASCVNTYIDTEIMEIFVIVTIGNETYELNQKLHVETEGK